MQYMNKINQLNKYLKSNKAIKDLKPILHLLDNALKSEESSDWNKAAQYYKECITYDENNPLFLLKLATILNRQKKTEDAKTLSLHAINTCLSINYPANDAINTHPSFFLERHLIAEFIIQNKKTIKEKIIKNSNTNLSKPNKVFVFWDKDETMPEVVKACRQSLLKYVNQPYELIQLNEKNLHKYLDIPKDILEKMQKYPAHFSDWLRTKLLKKYGGIWLDSTCMLSQDLSSCLKDIEQQESFFYCYKGSRVGSWFFYSKNNTYILNAIDSVLDLWWEEEGYLTNYFMYHDIVEMLYWTDAEYKNNWDKMLKIHPKPALELNKNLSLDFDIKSYSNILKSYFIHKLTYKVSQNVYEFDSYMNHIIESNIPQYTNLKLLLKSASNWLLYCTKVWNYQKKVDVLEFEYNNRKFAYDIYKKENQYVIDLVVRNESFNKIFPEIKQGKLKNFFTSDKLDKNILTKLHQTVLNKIDANYLVNVSIIVTTFNRENSLPKLLESLKNQINENINYEVIIIDDKSTDNSSKLIQDFINKHNLKNFKYYERPYNSGNPSIPRNDGIFLAKGKYVFFVDSDDYIHHETVKNSYELANKNNSDITFIRIGSTSGNRKGFGEKLYSKGTIQKAQFIQQSLYQCPQIFCFFNKDFLLENRILFNPSHKKWEDLIFISKALNLTNKYSILADKIYYFLEDFQDDNLTLKDLNIYQQTNILVECHNFYLFNQNIEKYSGFLNRLINFLTQKLKSNLLSIDEKFFVFNTISSNINFDLIDFKYIESENNMNTLKALLSKNFNKLKG